MVWKKIKASTSVDVEIDIDEVDTPTLLQALLNRGALRESEAESIAERRENDFATSGYPPPWRPMTSASPSTRSAAAIAKRP